MWQLRIDIFPNWNGNLPGNLSYHDRCHGVNKISDNIYLLGTKAWCKENQDKLIQKNKFVATLGTFKEADEYHMIFWNKDIYQQQKGSQGSFYGSNLPNILVTCVKDEKDEKSENITQLWAVSVAQNLLNGGLLQNIIVN